MVKFVVYRNENGVTNYVTGYEIRNEKLSVSECPNIKFSLNFYGKLFTFFKYFKEEGFNIERIY